MDTAKFRVVEPGDSTDGSNEFILVTDRWNDWYKWVTQFYLVVRLPDGSKVDVGSVKIARAGMTEDAGQTALPQTFSELDDQFFSVGQSENYYETLIDLGDDVRLRVLEALKDCAYSMERFERFKHEPAMQRSLLRDIDTSRVKERLNRLAGGSAALTDYKFAYTLPRQSDLDDPPTLDFKVVPVSTPPTNVHVIIGRNGVGKTRLFDLLARTFLGLEAKNGSETGSLRNLSAPWQDDGGAHGFAGLVTVSFSIFDSSGPLVRSSGAVSSRYSYIGLLRFPNQDEAEQRRLADREFAPNKEYAPNKKTDDVYVIKTGEELAREFVSSVEACREGARRSRWARALRTLEADPLFAEANIAEIADLDDDEWSRAAYRLFRNLSSGHSVVLLAITRLVAVVEEQSLVLLDEPEAHLHPPLISAFVRALSDLLIDRNGVAITATHSPVVLQEVPASCVWVLNRSGKSVRADRPEIETFGENVSTLTREVFNLEVVNSGFHRLISDAAEQGLSYQAILNKFGNQIGAEGRTLARALTSLASRPNGPDLEVI